MGINILEVKQLSKRYRIKRTYGRGWRSNQNILAEDISRIMNKMRGKNTYEKTIDFWALKDVSFVAKQGDIIGVIGRNGAGKSTLLKLLSRVSEPTSGKAIVYGRVGSLLEIGTGFHSELTGRENIFVSGAVLGMTSKEIKKKFDEIVSFSGVEEFLETPVKRFSSGMEVRLAFSVAAHLNPQVLLIDEVLSVGDAAFREKSIKKIKRVSENGGTILFVSHNMNTVASICNQAIVLDHGQISFPVGEVSEAIDHYLTMVSSGLKKDLDIGRQGSEPGAIKITGFKLIDKSGGQIETLTSGEFLSFQINYQKRNQKLEKGINIEIFLKTLNGEIIAKLDQDVDSGLLSLKEQSGKVICTIEKLPLAGGTISISIVLKQHQKILDKIEDAFIGNVDSGGHYERRRQRDKQPWVNIDHKWSLD